MSRTVLEPELIIPQKTGGPGSASHHTAPPVLTEEERLRRLRQLATLMDSAWELPGTGIRVGLDSIVGLVPVVGDIATALFSLHIVNEARRMGASRYVLFRMMGNVALDATAGSVPLVGDMFDAAWKANLKNLDLLERHIARRKKKEQKQKK